MAFKKEIIEIIEPRDIFVGPKTAPVTLVEFGEYENEDCAKAHEVVKKIMEEYEGKVRFNFRHFPLTKIHQRSMKAGEASVLATVLDPRFDVRRAALFDTSAKVEGKQVQTLPEPLDIVAAVTSYEPGRVSIQLDKPAPEGSALMVSENWYPGWTATVDGKPAVLGRAAVTFIGIALPAGARSVQLAFDSVSYDSGKRVTLIAILVALLAGALGFLVDRRRARRV